MASLREIGIVVAVFLVEYVVTAVASEGLVEDLDVASNTDGLVAGVTAAVVVVVAFADVVFDDDYIVCVAVDAVVVVSYVFLLLLLLLLLMMPVSLLLLMLMRNIQVVTFEIMIW